MKKKTAIILLIVAVVLTFVVTVGATETGILNSVFTEMRTDVTADTNSKIADLNNQVQAVVEDTLGIVKDVQSQRVSTELDKYLDSKLVGIENSPVVIDSSIKVQQYATTLIAEEKARIDQALTAALGN